jgi:hypothetical protein
MRFAKFTLLVGVLSVLSVGVSAQTLPVGTSGIEDYYRRSQLLGLLDSTTSFTIRPLTPGSQFGIKSPYDPDSTVAPFKVNGTSWSEYNGKFTGGLLPISLQLQNNSHHPYGWNDGAMIPAKGLQTLLSTGVYMKYGILSIQFKPEIVIAANQYFDDFNKDHFEVITARYYDFYNNVDLPARFGTGTYTKAYWGQSSIKLTYKALSFGLSTENLWWGPGMRNSLIMTNSAPGFKHLTLNTVKPIKTAIGSFEGQLIAGRLEGSGYPPLLPTREYFNNPLYVPKSNDWRYLSGFVVTWQPKWISGLFLGLTRTAQSYSNDLGTVGSYLPFFSPYKKATADEPIDKRDERSSVFMRWMWLQEHAEIYFEYGTNNNTSDFRNSLLKPEDARAYIFGIRKIMPFNKARNENIMINIEVAQLQETSLSKINSALSWYINPYIRQGYTNRGEVLGAGIGPGANLQSLDVSWIKGLKRLGLQFERYIHNNDFYYYAYQDSYDFRRHWVDLSVAANGEWNYKNLIFNAKVQGIKSLNYQWYLRQNIGDPYFTNGKDVFNLQLQAGITYRFL